MIPVKKLHSNSTALGLKKDIYANFEEMDDDGDLSFQESSNDGNSPRKQRKRRTLSETSKRDFVCGCGKSYVSYPAIYLHVQRKHNGDWPANTQIPEKSDNQDKVKRGRPKKEKHNMLDVNNDIQNEVKYKAEDNFWLFIGTKGNTGNPKLENRFITNLETQPYNAMSVFQHADLFENPEIHRDISQILDLASKSNGVKSITKDLEDKQAFETHLSYFILWISNPLKEEIFVELGIVISLLRVATLSCIWFEHHKKNILVKDEALEVTFGEDGTSVILKLSKLETVKLEAYAKNSVCPLLGPKWTEIKKGYNGNILSQIIQETKQIQGIDELFSNKLQSFSNIDNPALECLTETILSLKDTELKEITKLRKKFYFLNWNTKEDLKELIQKVCEWLQWFDEKELQLQDTEDLEELDHGKQIDSLYQAGEESYNY